MRIKNFTQKVTLVGAILLFASLGLYAQDQGTGTGWNNNYTPGSDLVLDEDFSHFEFFGNWQHTANSNSKPYVDETTGETIPGLMAGEESIQFLNSSAECGYTWDSCAFAPEWGVATSVDGDGNAVDPDPTTPDVSNGFVEIGRRGYRTGAGEFVVDLRALDYVEGIQYSHSSTGGTRRGFMIFISLDDGENWDTLRYQMGDHYSMNFTKDPFDWSKTPNDINCTPSANGMLWEDIIYTENVMLKFSATNVVEPQAVRIHDLKVYGDLPEETSVDNIAGLNEISIKMIGNNIQLSEVSNVEVYSITGSLVKTAANVNRLFMNDLTNGVYIVKAQVGNKMSTKKVVKQ
ncbi:MAG: T9SS type A sorting domain-containing protein [Prolixibacteraceae bacterium]|jgi:hypothetical protein|nr:T9SS type A sorting domain-containing protein [Prolixibacteraceae bacterium]